MCGIIVALVLERPLPSLETPELVAAIRARTGQSQEDLARQLDVSFATVNAWERGRTAPRATHRAALDRLAAELGIVQGLTALVIDDDLDAVRIAETMLAASSIDIDVVSTTDGSDGLLLCGSLKPDLVLLDVRMPNIDGFSVAEALDRIEGLEHTVLYFVTAHADAEVQARAFAAGADGVLSKPLTFERIERLVTGIAETDRARRGGSSRAG